MGRCETATASIGIKIVLSDLITQMNENNFNLIIELLRKGFIEDENDYFHEVYSNIIFTFNEIVQTDFNEHKEYLTNQFTSNGSYHKSRSKFPPIPTLDKGCLLDKILLIPIKDILSIDRWGHDRDSSNCVSRNLDFELSLDTEKYKEIKNFEIVFILGQHAG